MSPNVAVRDATPADHPRLAAIAEEGDSEADPAYLSFVARQGRLLVAEHRFAGGQERVVAFGGAIPVPAAPTDPDPAPIEMVTDLFVEEDQRGRGVGLAVLSALVAQARRRMTSSSKHPAAVPAYGRVGMQPRWNLLYLAGPATGGGRPLQPAPWAHDRPELIEYFASTGAVVTADAAVRVTADGAEVLREQSDDPITGMAAILAALPAGLPVRACVPAWQPLAVWLREQRGFRVEDHDVWCTTDGILDRRDVSCVHAGLA